MISQKYAPPSGKPIFLQFTIALYDVSAIFACNKSEILFFYKFAIQRASLINIFIPHKISHSKRPLPSHLFQIQLEFYWKKNLIKFKNLVTSVKSIGSLCSFSIWQPPQVVRYRSGIASARIDVRSDYVKWSRLHVARTFNRSMMIFQFSTRAALLMTSEPLFYHERFMFTFNEKTINFQPLRTSQPLNTRKKNTVIFQSFAILHLINSLFFYHTKISWIAIYSKCRSIVQKIFHLKKITTFYKQKLECK